MMTAARVTSSDSPFSTLQQRLFYVDERPQEDWQLMLETVPEWPTPPMLPSNATRDLLGYSSCFGDRKLVEIVCDRQARAYGIRSEPENVVITNGAQHGLALVFSSLARPGARAICIGPVLRGIGDMLRASGYALEFVDWPARGIDLEELANRLTADVALVFLNSPNNPTGRVIHPKTMAAMVQLTSERRIALVADLVYDSFLFDGAVACSPLAYTDDWSRVFTLHSMSKNYGAPGLRVGWVVSSASNIRILAARVERENISVSGIGQRQAVALLEHGNQPLVDAVVERRAFLLEELRKYPAIHCQPPDGGSIAFLGLDVGDVEAFGDYALIHQRLVLVTSGHYAGVAATPHVRFPLGCANATSARALESLSAALAAIRDERTGQ